MSSLRLVLASLTHHRRVNGAVALGVAVATAVLTGALLVGDSMHGSLRGLAVERLGRIDHVLVTDRFFTAELVQRVAASEGFGDELTEALPAILLEATVENPADHRKAHRVKLLGVGPQFWDLGAESDPSSVRPAAAPADDEIVLNRPLADALGVKEPGAEVMVRFAQPATVAAESTLGRKSDTIRSRLLRVTEILPAVGLGRFDLRASQQPPHNAFTSLETLQSLLDKPARVNAILVAGRSADAAASVDASVALSESLRPTLADYGITLTRRRLRHQGEVVLDYFDLTSDRLLLPEEVEREAMAAFSPWRPQPAFTYLANWITWAGPQIPGDDANPDDRRVPYSTVTAIDSTAELGPCSRDVEDRPIGPLRDDEIVINSWLFTVLHDRGVPIRLGDPIRLTYFDPEREGVEHEVTFRLKAVTPLGEPRARPTPANVPELTPVVPGVTDQATIRHWNPPFDYKPERIRSTDDAYWTSFRATPKAFVSLAVGRRLWGSRFGRTTSIRVPARAGLTAEMLRSRLEARLDSRALGFEFQPVKQQALDAAEGTTPFSLLFLGFSMFLLAAALMLVALLFGLGLEQRAGEIGLLTSVGFTGRRIALLMDLEILLIAASGGLLGVVGGVGYGALLVHGLSTWWVEAVVTPFLRFHFTPGSLLWGWLYGSLVSGLAASATLWRMRKRSPRALLAGRVEESSSAAPLNRPLWLVALALLAAAAATALWAVRLDAQSQAPAFFAAGALVLTGLLVFMRDRLRRGGVAVTTGRAPLLRLALRNAGRNPSRSSLTIGLVASASFLIVAISAFRLDPAASGAGGFALYVESDLPLHRDLRQDRRRLGFTEAQDALLAEATILALRVKPGDDASCLNVYRPRQPRILGVPLVGAATLVGRPEPFAWADSLAETADERADPWRLLDAHRSHAPDGPTPVVLDANTATYSLKVGVGDTLTFLDGKKGKMTCRVVGLLKNSVFQGDVLMDEREFVRHFPEVGGRRLFLLDAPPDRLEKVAEALQAALGDYGLRVERCVDRLRAFFAVQNTYLATFQSLGGLGLLLGTLGLAAVQLRAVLERRGELALLRAAGFRRSRLARMVLWENAVLLVAGLAVGAAAALAAVFPHLVAGSAAIPWRTLAATFALIAAAGLAAGLAAAAATLRAHILPALRGD